MPDAFAPLSAAWSAERVLFEDEDLLVVDKPAGPSTDDMVTRLRAFLAARDFLLARRTDYAAAYAGFEWPKLERFNWALDYFDAMANGNNEPALRIVRDDGSDRSFSFAELSRRSNQIANALRSLGARRGDRRCSCYPTSSRRGRRSSRA
jgi:hypothetical protein